MADDEKTPEEQAPETPETPETPEAPAAQEPAAEAPEQPAAETPAADEAPVAQAPEEELEEDEDEEEPTPRVKPAIPGADLEVDIVREGEEALRGESGYGEYDEDDDGTTSDEEDLAQPIADAAIDLAAGARYTATGKRKTAVARVILKPGTGTYSINNKSLEVFFPRETLQRNIR